MRPMPEDVSRLIRTSQFFDFKTNIT